MRYLVKARVKPGREAALLRAIEEGTLGRGSVAGDEYLWDMQQARVTAKENAQWVEVCFCRVPLEEERPYWEEYFDLISVKDAHARQTAATLMGLNPGPVRSVIVRTGSNRNFKALVSHSSPGCAVQLISFDPSPLQQTQESHMEIKRAGSQPSSKGPADWFTGTVRVDSLFAANAPARTAGASVTFEAGARTAWHMHPLGQTLIVTSGAGRVQREGGPIEEIRPGDVVRFAPNEKHWHGAAPTTSMTHIAIQEALDGKVVEWMEQVSDEQYGN